MTDSKQQASDPKAEARKAWDEHQGWFNTKLGAYYIPAGRNVVEDYKAALRSEIEKMDEISLMDKMYKLAFLKMIDEVKPL